MYRAQGIRVCELRDVVQSKFCPRDILVSELGKRRVGGNDQSVMQRTVGLVRCMGESGDGFVLIMTYSVAMVNAEYRSR